MLRCYEKYLGFHKFSFFSGEVAGVGGQRRLYQERERRKLELVVNGGYKEKGSWERLSLESFAWGLGGRL